LLAWTACYWRIDATLSKTNSIHQFFRACIWEDFLVIPRMSIAPTNNYEPEGYSIVSAALKIFGLRES